MLSGFAALAASIGGAFLVFRGVDVFDCQSVSFSSQLTTCFPHTNFGMVSGEVAGAGLVTVGAVLFYFALVHLASVK